MNGLGLLAAAAATSMAGACLGFVAGLVPGLHMNNVAAAVSAYGAATLGAFAVLGGALGTEEAGLIASCLLSSAVISHIFAESVSSAYVGIPAGDVVSVLPAHRLAKAGLGHVAVRAASDGALVGVLLGSAALLPLCAVMGEPVRFYEYLSGAMGVLVVLFSSILVLSEGWPSLRYRVPRADAFRKIAKAACVLLMAGVLGVVVLDTQFCSCAIPDFPWVGQPISRSGLLLPLFAGLFGVPSLILSVGTHRALDATRSASTELVHRPGPMDMLLCLLGGAIVGWLPGMTSGSAATLCAPGMREDPGTDDLRGSTRFIWLYSSISASGAVFALGALFVMVRARSGSMDAVKLFLGTELVRPWQSNLLFVFTLLFAFLISALLSHLILAALSRRLGNLTGFLCSRRLALVSMVFVCSLSAFLTGTRGLLVLCAAVTLGLLPPLVRVRRIQLMGCLLIPIALLFAPF